MSTTTISVRLDSDIKDAAESLFSELGLNMSVAVNAFLRQAVREQGIPFEIMTATPNARTVAAIMEGKAMLADPSTPTYSSIDELREALNCLVQDTPKSGGDWEV